MTYAATLVLALLTSGCTISSQFDTALVGKEKILQEILTAPTQVCVAAISMQANEIATLKKVLP